MGHGDTYLKRSTNCQALFGLEGVLSAYKTYEDRPREKIWVRKNLITTASKLYLLSSLWDPNVIADPIASLRVGTGGAIDPEGRFPKPESPTQTSLISHVITSPTSFVVSPTSVKVTYLADLDRSEGNGLLITEAGLFKSSGAMFNVKNFPAIPKTYEFGLHFEWSVKVV